MVFFRLIRIGNLIIILLTEFIVKYGVIDYFLSKTDITYRMNDWVFALIAISSVLIAAAANVHNDIHDQDIDTQEKPTKPIPSGDISVKNARIILYSFNIIGAILALIAAYIIGESAVAIFQLTIVALLFTYSMSFKCTKLFGNIIVSLVIAMVPIVIWLYSFYDIEAKGLMFNQELEWLHFSVIFLSVFAFLSNLIREIVKDREDMDGDLNCNCHTWASGVSQNTFRITVIIISLLLIEAITLYQVYLPGLELYRISFIIPQALILFGVIRMAYKANTRIEFRKLSKFIKLMTVSGLILPLILFFI